MFAETCTVLSRFMINYRWGKNLLYIRYINAWDGHIQDKADATTNGNIVQLL